MRTDTLESAFAGVDAFEEGFDAGSRQATERLTAALRPVAERLAAHQPAAQRIAASRLLERYISEVETRLRRGPSADRYVEGGLGI